MLIGLLYITIVSVGLGFIFPGFSSVGAISAASTFCIAILTVSYVVTTRKQLQITDQQLDEMRKARELSAQPLPFVELGKVYLEALRMFYTPPSDEYSVGTRVFSEFKIINNGTHPASNIIVSSKLLVPGESDHSEYKSASKQIDILSQNESYPIGEDPSSFMFSSVDSAELISVLIGKNIEKPIYLCMLLTRIFWVPPS